MIKKTVKKSKKKKNKGVDHCFAGTLRNVVNLWIIYGRYKFNVSLFCVRLRNVLKCSLF
jgi:hypothetical protein